MCKTRQLQLVMIRMGLSLPLFTVLKKQVLHFLQQSSKQSAMSCWAHAVSHEYFSLGNCL